MLEAASDSIVSVPVSSLGVALLNPPLSQGMATLRRVAAGATALGYSEWRTANMFSTATRDVLQINSVGASEQAWIDARVDLRQMVEQSDSLLIAWGVSGLTGTARRSLASQARWLATTANEFGHSMWWTVGGEARHPSRWHQYVSDKHGRANGESFAERFRSVAEQVPIRNIDLQPM